MVLIIAEAGVNHNGDIKIAKKLVDVAISCGADIIKFQSYKTENLVIPEAKKADYQKKNTLQDELQFEMLKKFEFSFQEQIDLKKYCDQKGIEFLSTGFDLESLNFLQKKIKLKRFKIPSGEITNLPYLRAIGSFKKPIILSTGMSNIIEIKDAITELLNSGAEKKDIIILHCTTEYPAPLKDINLKALKTIKEAFSIQVGYSDHSSGIEVSLAAAALGAKVIEKHITLDRTLEGPDHKSSLEPDEFSNLVKGIRKISIALGNSEKKISDSEIKNIQVTRKSIVARKKIKKGDFFSNENLCTKRPGTGISPMKWDEIIGSKAKKDFDINDLITN